MLVYLLKSGICLTTFYGFYKLLLEKESLHIFKRYYLLGALIVAFYIPFITFIEYIEIEPQSISNFIPEFQNNTTTLLEPVTHQTNYISIILWSIYILVVLLFSIKFIKNLANIITRIQRNTKLKNKRYINVLLQDLITPHTFFRYIFLNKHKFETHQIPKEVLLHEETHAKQKHSIDVLFIEILQILFWFNPLIYFIKHSIKLNHEFLADQAVINKGTSPSTYQKILLAFSSNATEPQLANAINYSSIKKRFTVMKTKTSKRAFWLRSLILLPLLAILIYSFSEKVIIKKEVVPIEPIIIQQSQTNEDANEAMMKEYKIFIENYEKADKKVIKMRDYQRVIAIYDIMSSTQKASVKMYPKIFPPNSLAKVKPKTPSEALYNSWKNKKEFAIWIDGKVVDNSELNKYSASNFKYYSSSFVYNNARSERFPQPYQNHLYTKTGFEESYSKANINKYNHLKNEYLKVKKEFINSGKTDDSDLRILRAQLNKLYNSLSKEEIKKYNIKNLNATQKNNNLSLVIKIIDNKTITINNKNCTLENFEYHLNDIIKTNASKEKEKLIPNIIYNTPEGDIALRKIKDILRAHNLLKTNKKVTKNSSPDSNNVEQSSQKKDSSGILQTPNKNITLLKHWYITIDNKKYYYPYKKGDIKDYYDENGNKVNLDIVKEYKKKNTLLEKLKHSGKHYIYKTKDEKQELDKLHSDLGGMYFRMLKTDKATVIRPKSLLFPYIKLTKKTGEVYYKKKGELTKEDKQLLPLRIQEHLKRN